MNRFAANATYVPMGCRDYLVVDFRVENVTSFRGVQNQDKLMTEFFSKSFMTCDVFLAEKLQPRLTLRT